MSERRTGVVKDEEVDGAVPVADPSGLIEHLRSGDIERHAEGDPSIGNGLVEATTDERPSVYESSNDVQNVRISGHMNVSSLPQVGVVVTLGDSEVDDSIMVADEVDMGLAEGRVEHHVRLGCLAPRAMLSEPEFGQRERVFWMMTCQLRTAEVYHGDSLWLSEGFTSLPWRETHSSEFSQRVTNWPLM